MLMMVPVLTASAFLSEGLLMRTSYHHSFAAAPSRVFSPVLMHERQDIERKVAELKTSWKNAAVQNAESGKALRKPSEAQFEIWADEHLTEEARAAEVLKSLEAELAASEAEAAAYWNSPEMVAAREARAAEREAAEREAAEQTRG